MSAYAYSRRLARASGSNFYWSFFFLPREKRDGLLSVYAFSRLVDDAVDREGEPSLARKEIELWKERLAVCYSNQNEKHLAGTSLDHPLVKDLRDTIVRFNVPRIYFEDLLKGMEMDLDHQGFARFKDLEPYCYHVAGTIGLLCNHLFGVDDERGRQYGILLGTAFQLTNIIRDIGSDADRGRVYIPRDELKQFRVSVDDLLKKRISDPFHRLMNFQSERADRYFQEAFQILPFKRRKRIIPAEVMTAFYRRILRKVRVENFPVFQKKVTLSTVEKLALVARTLARAI